MLRITLAAASFVLLGALTTQAAPLDRPPFEVGGGPIEPGILDPVNDCLRFPQLCEPGDPPPDPCIEHPELCDPEPPDPCPAGQLCPVDLCELVPSLCEEPPIAEPPVAEPPEQEVFDHSLAGNAKVKGEGFKTSEPFTLSLNADTAAGTFLAMDGDGTLYSGRLAPKAQRSPAEARSTSVRTNLACALRPAAAGRFPVPRIERADRVAVVSAAPADHGKP